MVQGKWRVTVALCLIAGAGLGAWGQEPSKPALSVDEGTAQELQKILDRLGDTYKMGSSEELAEVSVDDLTWLKGAAQALIYRIERKSTFIKGGPTTEDDMGQLCRALSQFGVEVVPITAIGMIGLTGPGDAVDGAAKAAEDLIANFAQPLAATASPVKDMEVTVHFLKALQSAEEAAQLVQGGAVDPVKMKDMAAVTQELTPLYGFEHFAVLETAVLRVQPTTEPIHVSGILLPQPADPLAQTRYSVSMSASEVLRDPDGSANAKFDAVSVSTELPIKQPNGGVTWRDIGFKSAFTIPLEKKVVVGKANLDASMLPTFIVLEARLVD